MEVNVQDWLRPLKNSLKGAPNGYVKEPTGAVFESMSAGYCEGAISRSGPVKCRHPMTPALVRVMVQ